MALVKCKECGSQVSTKAALCPQCGAKQPRRTTYSTWFVVVLAGIVGLSLVGKNSSREASPAPAKPLAAVAATAAPAPPPPPKPKDPNAIPETWAEFSASVRKDDKALVAQIEKMDVWKQCTAWGAEARKKVQARRKWALQASLQSRAMLNGVDLGGVADTVPAIGMTTCGALAVMGTPSDINRTKSSSGERTQLVWRDPRVYAYTQSSNGDGNAVIRSVQY